MKIVGMIPGIHGALALFRTALVGRHFEDMPIFDGRADGSWIGHYLEQWDPEVVYLEWTHPMPKNGSIASYSLGLNSGIVIGVVQAMGFALERVRPNAWKLAMGLRGQTEVGVAGDGNRAVPVVRRPVPPGQGRRAGRGGVDRQIRGVPEHSQSSDDSRRVERSTSRCDRRR